MGLMNALFGQKIGRMKIDQLKDHVYDVNTQLTSSKRRISQLEQQMDAKLEEAIDVQGSMLDVFVQEIAALEGEIEMESLMYSMYHSERMNIQELIKLREAEERMKRTRIFTGNTKAKELAKAIQKSRSNIRERIDSLKKTQDSLQRNTLGGSISKDDPRLEKFTTLISQIQNARAKGEEKSKAEAMHEFRAAVKQVYANQLHD